MSARTIAISWVSSWVSISKTYNEFHRLSSTRGAAYTKPNSIGVENERTVGVVVQGIKAIALIQKVTPSSLYFVLLVTVNALLVWV
jgi:hypothetical protein